MRGTDSNDKGHSGREQTGVETRSRLTLAASVSGSLSILCSGIYCPRSLHTEPGDLILLGLSTRRLVALALFPPLL